MAGDSSTRDTRAGYADGMFGQVHYILASGTGGLPPLVVTNPRSRSCLGLLPFIEPERDLLIIDIPSYGNSAPPRGDCTMSDVAEAALAVLDKLGISAAHLCGVHTGAKVMAALAANHPTHVLSLAVCGKSHSIIPGHEQRNRAMKAQVAARKPDVALMAMESFCADDADKPRGAALVYEANFAFDLAGAIARAKCPVRVIEFTAPDEDALHGRQAAALAAYAAQGSSAELGCVDRFNQHQRARETDDG